MDKPKRGAPFGNKNRLTHGRYAAEAVAARKARAAAFRRALLLRRAVEALAVLQRAEIKNRGI
jgi:hypothetical protein